MNIIDIIKSGDYLVLDCETTGLDKNAEICQIAIISSNGEILLDTLVKPVSPIPAEATAIHGITNEMVADAKPFPYNEVAEIIHDKNVVIYNSGYDTKLMAQSEGAITGVYAIRWFEMANYYCAMKHFAGIYGDWNEYRKSYKWKSLSVACGYYGIEVPADAHSALADCKSTLAVCKAMAASEVVE